MHKRKDSEEVSRLKEKYGTLFDNAGLLVSVFDNSGVCLMINRAAAVRFGGTPDAFVGKKISDLYPETADAYDQRLRAVIVSESDRGYEDLVAFPGGMRWLVSNLQPVKDATGRVFAVQMISQDITAIKRAEQSLKGGEEKFRNLFDLSPQATAVTQAETGKFIDVNQRFCELSKYSRADLIGQTAVGLGIFSAPEHEKYVEKLRREGEVRGVEMNARVKGGSTLNTLVFSRYIHTEEGQLIFTVLQDQTAQKRLEAHLRQVQKMDAIATLAGGIAHEFNNALVGVTGNIELLQMEFPEDGSVEKYCEKMKASAQRMASLTSQLLAYARGGKFQTKSISLSDFVEETLSVLKSFVDPDIRTETRLPRDIHFTRVDPTQMQMVLSSVVANASEAIEGTGRIRIATRNEIIDDKALRHYPGLEPGPYVCLEVKDDGKGMDNETRNRIFEPFFSGKFQGRGLGMAAVYGIVKNHDGWVAVDSEPGNGAAVRIYLPAFDPGRPAGARAAAGRPAEKGTVLVVDDERQVLDVTRAIFEKTGYRVLTAGTGEEAISIARTHPGEIDLAVLDIVFPGMGGKEIYPELMAVRPDLKVIVSSGYDLNGPARDLLEAGAQGFIQKPFSPRKLLEMAREILEGKETGP